MSCLTTVKTVLAQTGRVHGLNYQLIDSYHTRSTVLRLSSVDYRGSAEVVGTSRQAFHKLHGRVASVFCSLFSTVSMFAAATWSSVPNSNKRYYTPYDQIFLNLLFKPLIQFSAAWRRKFLKLLPFSCKVGLFVWSMMDARLEVHKNSNASGRKNWFDGVIEMERPWWNGLINRTFNPVLLHFIYLFFTLKWGIWFRWYIDCSRYICDDFAVAKIFKHWFWTDFSPIFFSYYANAKTKTFKLQ